MTNKHGDSYSNTGTSRDRLHFKARREGLCRVHPVKGIASPLRHPPLRSNDGASVDVWVLCPFHAELFLLLPQKNNIYIRLFRVIHQILTQLPEK